MASSQNPSANGSAPHTAAERSDDERQRALRDRGALPTHIACIMDGNGRWAQERDEARVVGHHEGVASVRDVTEACAELGVDYLTLYTFSTENWERPDAEIDALMELLVQTVQEERATLMENGVQLEIIGDVSELPASCQDALRQTKRDTADNDRLTLTLALSYSGRWDILRAARDLAAKAEEGECSPDDIDAALFEEQLATSGMPDPDLLVRTGGEYRLSNFLLWQSAYAELYITDEFWPAFRRAQLYEAVRSYQDRDRRFGRIERSPANGS
ncbi:MAG: isoprenyl transferase [Salinibacter sp.]|jgi:Undecaprenyl pyrophosphate synthetase (EC 2.5.1.31)|uniref:isoprenyl transferase n=1 Tax=Salinibacter sp. TaxID=2065818 RepID=UPI002FC398B7